MRSTLVPVASTEDDPRVGSIVCMRYQVRRVVADGGMGRVYQALDLQDKAGVAVKVLHPDVARDPVAVERFKREYEVSKLLPHEHIVDVRDFRETEDKSYALVMEYLEGEELRTLIKRDKRLPPERIVRMLSQVAIGLDSAHRQRLVHRDLKPDNIFLCGTREGDIVKVLDFGSVKDKSSMAKKLTVVGTTIGSPFYMAPEQAQGLDTLDARADVWALAAITYECITGTVPFQGVNGPSILLSILTKDPEPPTQAGKDSPVPIPPAIDDLMEVALAKNPNIRTRTVGEFADALGHAYGLTGSHTDWAYTPQAALAQAIQVALPKVMAGQQQAPIAPTAPAMPAAVQGGHAPPPAMGFGGPEAMAMQPMVHSYPTAAEDNEFVMGVPKAFPRWAIGAIFVVVAIILFVLGALFLQ
jgi:serine/threonine protein kinase